MMLGNIHDIYYPLPYNMPMSKGIFIPKNHHKRKKGKKKGKKK